MGAKPVSGKRDPLYGINKRTLTIVEGKRTDLVDVRRLRDAFPNGKDGLVDLGHKDAVHHEPRRVVAGDRGLPDPLPES